MFNSGFVHLIDWDMSVNSPLNTWIYGLRYWNNCLKCLIFVIFLSTTRCQTVISWSLVHFTHCKLFFKRSDDILILHLIIHYQTFHLDQLPTRYDISTGSVSKQSCRNGEVSSLILICQNTNWNIFFFKVMYFLKISL